MIKQFYSVLEVIPQILALFFFPQIATFVVTLQERPYTLHPGHSEIRLSDQTLLEVDLVEPGKKENYKYKTCKRRKIGL